MKQDAVRDKNRDSTRMGLMEYLIIAGMVVVGGLGVFMYFGGMAWLFD